MVVIAVQSMFREEGTVELLIDLGSTQVLVPADLKVCALGLSSLVYFVLQSCLCCLLAPAQDLPLSPQKQHLHFLSPSR